MIEYLHSVSLSDLQLPARVGNTYHEPKIDGAIRCLERHLMASNAVLLLKQLNVHVIAVCGEMISCAQTSNTTANDGNPARLGARCHCNLVWLQCLSKGMYEG